MTIQKTVMALDFKNPAWIGMLGSERTSIFKGFDIAASRLSVNGAAVVSGLFKFKHVDQVIVDPSKGSVFVKIIGFGDVTESYLGVKATMSQFELAMMMPPDDNDEGVSVDEALDGEEVVLSPSPDLEDEEEVDLDIEDDSDNIPLGYVDGAPGTPPIGMGRTGLSGPRSRPRTTEGHVMPMTYLPPPHKPRSPYSGAW